MKKEHAARGETIQACLPVIRERLWEVSVYPASVQYPNKNSGVVFNDQAQSVVSDADSEIGAIGLEFLHIADGLDSGRCLDQKYCLRKVFYH